MDSHLYVSKKCKYSAGLIQHLHEKGTALPENLKVLWVEDYHRSSLPNFVDRVPTLLHKNKVYQDKELKDFFFGEPLLDVEGLHNGLSDVCAPLEGPGCTDSWADYMDFRIECPADDKPDNRKFDLEQLQKARQADLPNGGMRVG